MHAMVRLLALGALVAFVMAAGCTGEPGTGTVTPTPTPIEMNVTVTETETANETVNETETMPETTVGVVNETSNETINETETEEIEPSGESVTFDLSALNNEFNTDEISVPAGAPVIINFDNQDEGVDHNFAAYKTDAAVEVIFRGDVITGPAEVSYTFTAPEEPGTYFFRCDVHPTQMTGDFIVT
ncbi:plastocyanin [Methanofollis sp. W23]|uniref:cupredoxin domain-containing protein n=1 Tax=Methanofollis sp. W23 TaxID=2817849 RepID=UPI001D2485A9|nr:cupredoxin domain-containing protein [Methanofollis sp. W23]MBP2145365.1 plastocyanin [Methanofollis sp. W23]